MSINQSVLGLIFASINDSTVADLTKDRTMGSIPYGGRYRTVDFPLSNMVNSGITEVGVITKSNYASLMDHLGSGREWDLARKKGGLHLLPPFSQANGSNHEGRLDALIGISKFVEHTKAEYVVLANCDVITTIDFTEALAAHRKSGADITVIYARQVYHYENNRNVTVLEIGEDNLVNDVLVDPMLAGECNISLDMFLMRTDILRKIVLEAASRNQKRLIQDVLQGNKDNFRINAFEHRGKFFRIDSMDAYYHANMELLDSDVRNSLFSQVNPIYTKIGDNAPVKYGLESSVKNSMIADGCVIEGTVENCILFRGVKIGKGAVVRNCILMQGTTVGEDARLDNVITDKNARIAETRRLVGPPSNAMFIGKNARV